MKMPHHAWAFCSFLLGLALAPNLSTAQRDRTRGAGDRLGLSCERILAMGLDRWTEHYAAKRGRVVRSPAYGVYVGCMRERNAGLYRRVPTAGAQRVRRMDTLMRRYATLMAQNQNDYLGRRFVEPNADMEPVARAEYELLRLAPLPPQPNDAGAREEFPRLAAEVGDDRQEITEGIRLTRQGAIVTRMTGRLTEAAGLQGRLKLLWRDPAEAVIVLRTLRELTALREP